MQKTQQEVVRRRTTFADQQLTVQVLGPESAQEWTTDPDMLEVYLGLSALKRAARTLQIVRQEGLDEARIDIGVSYEVYEAAENQESNPDEPVEPCEGPDGKHYLPVEPEYRLDSAVLTVRSSGILAVKILFKDNRDYLYAMLGMIDELLTAAGVSAEPASAADQFVEEVANLSIWGYDRDDGTPYKECEEPDDGFMDSHEALMTLIEKARKLRS